MPKLLSLWDGGTTLFNSGQVASFCWEHGEWQCLSPCTYVLWLSWAASRTPAPVREPSPARHMETVEQTVPYPKDAQKQGEGLSCCKQRAIHALSLSLHLCSSSWDLPGEHELSSFSWELPQAHLTSAWLAECPSNGEERRPQEEDSGYREVLTFTKAICFKFLYSKQSIFLVLLWKKGRSDHTGHKPDTPAVEHIFN